MSIFLDEKEIPVFPYQLILMNDKFSNELQYLHRRWRTLTDPKKTKQKKHKKQQQRNTTAMRNYTKSGQEHPNMNCGLNI